MSSQERRLPIDAGRITAVPGVESDHAERGWGRAVRIGLAGDVERDE
jgi:hypothetical protein